MNDALINRLDGRLFEAVTRGVQTWPSAPIGRKKTIVHCPRTCLCVYVLVLLLLFLFVQQNGTQQQRRVVDHVKNIILRRLKRIRYTIPWSQQRSGRLENLIKK